MADERVLEYRIKVVDNVSEAASRASESAKRAGVSIGEADDAGKRFNATGVRVQVEARASGAAAGEATAATREYVETAKEAEVAMRKQREDAAIGIAALMGMQSAVSGVTSGLIGLGMVSEETAGTLRKVNAAFQIMTGLAAGVKALQIVTATLNMTNLKGAAIATYRSVLESPWKAALAGVGVGAAGALVGSLVLGGNRTENVTTVNVIGKPDEDTKKTSEEVIMVIEGGTI